MPSMGGGGPAGGDGHGRGTSTGGQGTGGSSSKGSDGGGMKGAGPSEGWGGKGAPSKGLGEGGGYGWGGSSNKAGNSGRINGFTPAQASHLASVFSGSPLGDEMGKALTAARKQNPRMFQRDTRVQDMRDAWNSYQSITPQVSTLESNQRAGMSTLNALNQNVNPMDSLQAEARLSRNAYDSPMDRVQDMMTARAGSMTGLRNAREAFNEAVDTDLGTSVRDALAEAFGSPNERSLEQQDFNAIASQGMLDKALNDLNTGMIRTENEQLGPDTTGEALNAFGSTLGGFGMMGLGGLVPVGGLGGAIGKALVSGIGKAALTPNAMSLGALKSLATGDTLGALQSISGPLGDVYGGVMEAAANRDAYGFSPLSKGGLDDYGNPTIDSNGDVWWDNIYST